MEAIIHNNSSFTTKEIIKAVKFICKEGEFPQKIEVEIADVWFEEDENGNRTYDTSVEWDGTAFDSNKVEIILSPKTEFPQNWWVNEKLEGNYVRGMYLENRSEYLIYCLAHELRHLWQWNNPRKKRLGSDYEGDDESDSDLFACLKLNTFRRNYKK